jgi:hypothetical protein
MGETASLKTSLFVNPARDDKGKNDKMIAVEVPTISTVN